MPVAPSTGQKEQSSRYHSLLQKPGHHSPLSPSLLSGGGNHVFPADPQACLQEIRQLATPGPNYNIGLHQSDLFNPTVHPLHIGRHTPPGLLAISSLEAHPFQHRSSPLGYDLREVPQRRTHQDHVGLPPTMPHSQHQYSVIRGNEDNHKSESPHRKRRRLSSHNLVDHPTSPSSPLPLSAWDHMCPPGGDRNMWRRNIPQRRIAMPERCNNSRCCRSPTNRRIRYRDRPTPWHSSYSVDQRNFQQQPVSAQPGANLHGQLHPHPGLLPHPTSPPLSPSQVQSMQQGFPLDAAQGMSPFQVSLTPPPPLPLCTSSSHVPLHSSPHFSSCGMPPFAGAGMSGATAMPAFSCSCCFHQVHSMHPAQQPASHQYSFLHANNGPHYMPPPRFQPQMPPMPSPLGQRSQFIPTPPVAQNPDGDESMMEHRPYPNLSPPGNHHIAMGYNGPPMAASIPLAQQLQDHGTPLAAQPDFFCMVRNSAQHFARRLNQPRHVGARRWRGPILTAGAPTAPPPTAYPGFILHFLAMLSNPSIPYMPEIASPESPEAENYEALLNLAERLGEAKPRGLTKAEIELLPSYRFNPETHESEQTSCVVCMCDFEPRQVLRVLPCGHEFHARCVDKWLKSNRTCPICRGDAAESG